MKKGEQKAKYDAFPKTRKHVTAQLAPSEPPLGSRAYLLLAGAVVVAIAAVGLIILLDQGAGRSSGDSGGLSPEKRLGAADDKRDHP